MNLTHYEVKITVDPTGVPLSAVVVRWWDDATYSVATYPPGPFDTPEDVWALLRSTLDIQLTLW